MSYEEDALQPPLSMSPTIRVDSGDSGFTNTRTNNSNPNSRARILSNIPLLRPDSLIEEESDEEDDPEFNVVDMQNSFNNGLYRTLSPERSLNNSPILNTNTFQNSTQNSAFSSPHNHSRTLQNFKNSPYNLANGSGSSINLPIPRQTQHVRTNSSTQQYIPGPMLPPRSKSPIRPKSPVRSSRGGSPVRSTSPIRSSSPTRKPFNFQSMMMHGNGSSHSISGDSSPAPTPTGSSAKAQYRRGHRYKHSSISMNMFQENVKKPALNIPKSYAIPSLDEVRSSLTSQQKFKIGWSFCHLFLAGLVYFVGFRYGNTSLSTLSHLVIYDALANLLLVMVIIMMNFDFWSSSSLKYPFGLGRIEVLVGFALSVSLLFVGVDLLSHIFEELVIELVLGHDTGASNSEHSHHIHETHGAQLNPVIYELLVISVIIFTLISSRVILGETEVQNHSSSDQSSAINSTKNLLRHKRKKTEILDEPLDTKITNTLANIKGHNTMNASTSHLTLLFAVYSMLYPILHLTDYVEIINQGSTVILACTVLFVSYRLILILSNILLLGKPTGSKSRNIDDSIRERIETLESYKPSYKIEDILLSRVNYKICIAIVKLKMYGASDEEESRLRFYTERIIREELTKSSAGNKSNSNSSESNVNVDKKVDDPKRKKSVVDFSLLNTEEFDYIDNTGETYEITIDIDRL